MSSTNVVCKIGNEERTLWSSRIDADHVVFWVESIPLISQCGIVEFGLNDSYIVGSAPISEGNELSNIHTSLKAFYKSPEKQKACLVFPAPKSQLFEDVVVGALTSEAIDSLVGVGQLVLGIEWILTGYGLYRREKKV